ncbi:MAG: carboxypeptidase regulatory-like domain-containing protein [Chitinophagales bacterium]|nr:carboxypeptidase regulatory-like domain-containing protein [Chitinophagales bacterium]
MKTLFKAAIAASALFVFCHTATATGGSVTGIVTDPDTKEPIENATIVFDCAGSQLVFVTDEYGKYAAGNLPACTYKVIVSLLGKSSMLENIVVKNDEHQVLDMRIAGAFDMGPIIVEGKPSRNALFNEVDPIITAYEGDELKKMGNVTRVTDVIQNFAGVVEFDGNMYVRGTRAGSLAYYIDGVKVMGDPNIPLGGVDFFRTYIGFVPPKYGDTTAGIAAIETLSYFGQY